MSLRDTVMRSLAAVGAQHEAEFYTRLFRAQDPERFALIVIDPRCLKNPLLEALISDLRILADLELTPVLLVGALDDDRTSITFQARRLFKELETAHIKTIKLNCASYGLLPDVARQSKAGRMVILEMTERRGKMNLQTLVSDLNPGKVIFLQPSGGLRRGGKRLAVVKLSELEDGLLADTLSPGQAKFIQLAGQLAMDENNRASYVMASPLNLLAELFTTTGSGTLMRRAAEINSHATYDGLDIHALRSGIEEAFSKPLDKAFFKRPIHRILIEKNFRGGAIFNELSGLPYLSKFWVNREAQGEGIARDIWEQSCTEIPAFFWRSREANPFNNWYMNACDGMQVSGDWRIFWKGLDAPEIPGAIIAAASAPHDFEYERNG